MSGWYHREQCPSTDHTLCSSHSTFIEFNKNKSIKEKRKTGRRQDIYGGQKRYANIIIILKAIKSTANEQSSRVGNNNSQSPRVGWNACGHLKKNIFLKHIKRVKRRTEKMEYMEQQYVRIAHIVNAECRHKIAILCSASTMHDGWRIYVIKCRKYILCALLYVLLYMGKWHGIRLCRCEAPTYAWTCAINIRIELHFSA